MGNPITYTVLLSRQRSRIGFNHAGPISYTSLDHPVGAGEQRRRDFEAERTGPRHQACCMLAEAPSLSHASPLARPPPPCRSRLRRFPFSPHAASLTGPRKPGRIWSTPEEKHEPVSDIDTVEVDSLKVLDPEWPIREADMRGQHESKEACLFAVVPDIGCELPVAS